MDMQLKITPGELRCYASEPRQYALLRQVLQDAADTLEALLRAGPEKQRRAFELGALAMRQLAMAKCGNATESLEEGIMTDAGLTAANRRAMNHQVEAITEVEKDIMKETPADAAYYGSYILTDQEKMEIRALFPDIARKLDGHA
jgi:hypothetical protein